jgi:DNA gyrase subunit B
MPEIIKNGYLYIAQPPLLKVGKGKKEKYLKDESQLNEYLLKKVCDQKQVKLGRDEIILAGHKLYTFIGDVAEYFGAISELEKRGIPQALIELLIHQEVADKTFLEDRERMIHLRKLLIDKGYTIDDLKWSEDHNVFEMTVKDFGNKQEEIIGISDRYRTSVKIGRGLIYSSSYQKSYLIGRKIQKNDAPPFIISDKDNGDEGVSAENIGALLDNMLREGRKGLTIQRYKGLGEMNPTQLWETTMNPEKRNLLQVKVEDLVGTDEIFTILMGEEVEPRRDFIQSNALEVSMLDI